MRVSHWYTAGVNARAPVKGMPQRSVGRWEEGGEEAGGWRALLLLLLAAERLLASNRRRGKSPPGLATRKEPHRPSPITDDRPP